MDKLDKWVGAEPMPFSLTGKKFSQETFYGRWRSFMDLINPFALLSPASQVQEAKDNLEHYRSHGVPKPDAKLNLWDSKWLVDSVYHPDTGKPVPILFRMSSFLPANIPILIGILLSPKTALSVPLWQAVNQTYNVGFNYCNRNLSNPFTNQQLITSYLLATSSSVVVAVGLDKLMMKYSKSPITRTFAPATALAIAGCLNLLVIRYKEVVDGVDVYDRNGVKVGRSKQAAAEGLTKTTFIRFALQYPGAFLPVIMAEGLKKMHMYPGAGLGKLGMDVGVITLSLLINLPAMFALYPQMLHKETLEPELKPPPGGFYFNRGI
jgi:tricarboxylate carrier